MDVYVSSRRTELPLAGQGASLCSIPYKAGAPAGARCALTQEGITGWKASAGDMPLLRSSLPSLMAFYIHVAPSGARPPLSMTFITGDWARKVLPPSERIHPGGPDGARVLKGGLFYRYAAPPGPGGPAVGQMSIGSGSDSLHWHIGTLTHSHISSASLRFLRVSA